jgi:hypothetical protein
MKWNGIEMVRDEIKRRGEGGVKRSLTCNKGKYYFVTLLLQTYV